MFLNRVSEPGSNRRKFQRLFLNEDQTHPFFLKNHSTSNHLYGSYTIVAEDFFGNRSVAIIPIEKTLSKESTSLSKRVSTEYWTYDWISTNDSTNFGLRNLELGVLWNKETNQRLIKYQEDPNYTISRIQPGKSYSITSPDFSIKTLIEPQTFFDTVSIIQNLDLKNDSLFVEIGKPEIPIRKNISLQIQVINNYQSNPKTNLYTLKPDNSVNYVDSWMNGVTLNASIGSLGKFIVLTDTTLPKIFTPKKSLLDSGLETYTIKTEDDLSGIDFQSAIISINGLRGIPEYDYENDTFTFYLPGFKPTKKDSIYMEIKDNAGNFISKSFLLYN